MAVTLHDVAKLAGVSFMTVSLVVNERPNVRPETRQRVLDAIAQLHYRPNLSARGLRSGRTGSITLALPELSLSYFAELADAIIKAAERHKVAVVIEPTGGDRAREIALLNGPRLRLTDGLLFVPLALTSDDGGLLDIRTPLVVIGDRIFGGPSDHVTMESKGAARAATEHLLSIGRRRIALLGAHEGPAIGSAGLRVQGYAEALTAAALPYDPELVVFANLWHREDGANAMRALLGKKVEFDAVFGLNDTLALGAMRVLREFGLRIPEDVAVMGFDDLDESRFAVPALSSVNPGVAEIAERSVSLLTTQIEQRRLGADWLPTEFRASFTIVPRESTIGKAR